MQLKSDPPVTVTKVVVLAAILAVASCLIAAVEWTTHHIPVNQPCSFSVSDLARVMQRF